MICHHIFSNFTLCTHHEVVDIRARLAECNKSNMIHGVQSDISVCLSVCGQPRAAVNHVNSRGNWLAGQVFGVLGYPLLKVIERSPVLITQSPNDRSITFESGYPNKPKTLAG